MTARVKGWSTSKQLSFRYLPRVGPAAYRPHQVRSIQSRPPAAAPRRPTPRAGLGARAHPLALCLYVKQRRPCGMQHRRRRQGLSGAPPRTGWKLPGPEPTRQAPLPLRPVEPDPAPPHPGRLPDPRLHGNGRAPEPGR